MSTKEISSIEYLIPTEALEEHRSFLEEYCKIRDDEGRGSNDPAFYLQLPDGNFAGLRAHEWELRAQSLIWLQNYLAEKDQPLAILDAGAGNCWLTRYLVEWGHSAVALDINDDADDGLAAGRHYLEHLPIAFRRVVADFSHLPFQANSFDAVIYNGAIHYAIDLAPTITEGLRCLKPGGELILIDTPFYRNQSSGEKMLAEREKKGRAGYLTYQLLQDCAAGCGIQVQFYKRPASLLQSVKQRIAERIRGREFAAMPWVVLRKPH